MTQDLYQELGIDAKKALVAEIFGGLVDRDFPLAFCNIVRDPLFGGYVFTKSSDGSGSKPIQRVLYFLETGDETVFYHDAFDGYSMNAGDIGASGFLTTHFVDDTIIINALNLDKGRILQSIRNGLEDVMALYAQFGFKIIFVGGETADLPDQVLSYTLDINIFSRMLEVSVIKGEVEVGDVIFGFSSGGQAVWETEENSGVMDNGLTLARKALMQLYYSKRYPFLCHPDKPFFGRFKIDDKPDCLGGMTVNQAILSPTRQWAIVMKLLVDELRERQALHLLHGMVMNTGGGNTKVLHIGEKIRYVKEMPQPLPIFQLIQEECQGKVSWEEMFIDFNCGVGMDVVGSPEGGILKQAVEAVSEKYSIDYFELGQCEASDTGKNQVVLSTPYGTWSYNPD